MTSELAVLPIYMALRSNEQLGTFPSVLTLLQVSRYRSRIAAAIEIPRISTSVSSLCGVSNEVEDCTH